MKHSQLWATLNKRYRARLNACMGEQGAAMLMAIVANKLGKPLNTLRFKSMKEVI